MHTIIGLTQVHQCQICTVERLPQISIRHRETLSCCGKTFIPSCSVGVCARTTTPENLCVVHTKICLQCCHRRSFPNRFAFLYERQTERVGEIETDRDHAHAETSQRERERERRERVTCRHNVTSTHTHTHTHTHTRSDITNDQFGISEETLFLKWESPYFLSPFTPSGVVVVTISQVCHTTFLPHQGVLASVAIFNISS